MSVAVKTKSVASRTYNQELVGWPLWTQLTGRIAQDNEMSWEAAEGILNEALNFLRLVAASSGRTYTPSAQVDLGWHAFILHTRDYAAFCQSLAGRFIHHVPTPHGMIENGDDASVCRTVEALRSSGFDVDTSLWLEAAECGGQRCYNGDCSSGR